MDIDELRIEQLFADFGRSKIVIIGDLMLDRYLIGDVQRISPEAPVPVVEIRDETLRLGGAANVALNIKRLGDEPVLLGVYGHDSESNMFNSLLESRGIDFSNIVVDDNRPTTVKTRIIASNQQVVRADDELVGPVSEQVEKKLIDNFKACLAEISGVIISDYGKGVITPGLLEEIIRLCRKKDIFVAVDPKDVNFRSYRDVSVITPNHHEAGFAYGRKIRTDDDLQEVGRGLLDELNAQSILITRGAEGMALFEKEGQVTYLNTVARRVFDVTGAGDTVIAAFTSAVASGASLPEAAFISNQAAGMVVEELGTAQVSRFELFSQIKRYLKGEASGKIVSLERLLALKDQWKDKKVVFTNGVFDLLHYGHIKLLTDCKKLGDILIVGLNSDRSVHRIKGPERPIIPYTDRSRVLAALEAVDYVIPFDDETPLELIKNIKPDILAKGADYAISEIVGAEQVKNNGGEVVRVKLQPGLSTTEIINRIVATSES